MIKLFGVSDKLYSSNGDKIILPTRAKVHKEDNGEYYLDIETSLDYVNDLVEGNILVAPTPQGEQAFRITNPQKTRKKITVKAYHVFYDSKNYLIADSNVVDKNCNDALDHLNNATDTQSPFTTLSNIMTVDSYRCVRTSLYDAIQTVIERWGGHLVRDNWNIKLLANIGQDNGVTVRYAKNLKEINCTENWDDVVTKLLPTGTDGIMLNELDDTIDPYVYPSSELMYDIPYTKTIAFEQTINQDNYINAETGQPDVTAYKQALIADLRAQAQAYIDINCLPKVNYTLKANIDKITDIGDIIEVIDERLNIDLITSIISYDYDCILGRFAELEFGNFKKKLSNLTQNIVNTAVEQVFVGSTNSISAVQAQLEQAQADIMGIMGNSYVIYDGDQILIVDRLPKDTATNVIRINSEGIGLSSSGIYGNFTSAWTIDGTLNLQALNVINLTADLIKGGTLKLGTNYNQSGILEIYGSANNLIGRLDASGLKMYGVDGSYIVVNNQVGFAGYDRLGNKTFWADKDVFKMKKAVIDNELSIGSKMRFVPMQTANNNGIALIVEG